MTALPSKTGTDSTIIEATNVRDLSRTTSVVIAIIAEPTALPLSYPRLPGTELGFFVRASRSQVLVEFLRPP